jgi:glycosyltransferase involved in cell wall biosynthesis
MLLHKLLKHVFDRCYTHAFACSEKAGRWLYGEKTFTIINNGIPVEKFLFNKTERDRIRKKLNCEKNKVIGHVGHFSYQKNQEFLIKIFTEIYKKDNSYRLLLVGDGDFRDKIEEAAVKNGVKDAVIFYGETFNVSEPLQAMDIFVFPSRFEGLGMAVIEAQAAGLPCIVSDAVPNVAKITKQMEYVSLEDPLEVWVNKILEAAKLDRESCFEENKEQIENSIYNIKKEACKLKNLYYRYVFEK